MITDKDREVTMTSQNLLMYLRNGRVEDDEDGDPDIVFEIETHDAFLMIENARAESADQARKEAAERAVRFFDDFRICVPPNKYNMPQETLEQLRAAIIGDSVIKENLTTDHKYDCAAYATEGKTDSEKLSVAVKALYNIRYLHADDDPSTIVCEALKGIQG